MESYVEESQRKGRLLENRAPGAPIVLKDSQCISEHRDSASEMSQYGGKQVTLHSVSSISTNNIYFEIEEDGRRFFWHSSLIDII